MFDLNSKYFKVFTYLIIFLTFTDLTLSLNWKQLWIDELVTLRIVNLEVSKIVEVSSTDTNSPLYYLLLKFLSGPFSNNLAVLSLANLLISTACVFMVKKTSDLLFKNKELGFLPALLFITTPFFLYFSTQIRSYMLVILFALCLFYLVWMVIERVTIYNYKFHVVLFSILYFLSFFLHLSFFFYLFILNIFILLNAFVYSKDIRSRLLILFIFSNALALFGSILILIFKVPAFDQINVVLNIIRNNIIDGNPVTFVSFFSAFLNIPLLITVWSRLYVQIIILVLLTISLIIIKKVNKSYFILNVLLFLSPVILCLNIKAFNFIPFKYISYMLPFLTINFSYLLFVIGQKIGSLRWVKSVFYFSIFLFFISYFVYLLTVLIQEVRLPEGNHGTTNCYNESRKMLQRDSQNGKPLLLVIPPWEQAVFAYYGNNFGVEVKGVNTISDPEGKNIDLLKLLSQSWLPTVDDSTVEYLENYIKDHKEVYLWNFDSDVFDDTGISHRWLVSRSTRFEKVEFICNNWNTNTFYKYYLK